MNDRTIKLGATLGAVALAFAAPAIASAQDQDTAMPADNTAPVIENTPAEPMASHQLDRLQSLGFVNASEVLTAQIDPNAPTTFDYLPSEQLDMALDSVQVQGPETLYTLRQYLNAQGVDPSTIVGLSVHRNNVVIAHT